MLTFDIQPLDRHGALSQQLQAKIDNKTKPLGSLGRLEAVALQIGLIQNSLKPRTEKPQVLVFAADHGLAQAGISAYPAEVTRQMVGNFLNGGAAINVFCRQHQLPLWVVDAGVNHDFAPHPRLIEAKIKHGTANMLHQAAMRVEECQDAIERGAAIVRQFQQQGCNTLLLGEMGIGNTAAASLLLHKLTDWPLADCVGKGAGLDDAGLQRKQRILQQVLQYHAHVTEPLAVLATFGGLELAMLVGAYGQAAELRMVCVVDGFIASVAVLVAAKRYPAVLDYCLFAHQSAERGHQALLRHLNANPLLSLDLRLGEASGAVLAYPLLQAALLFLTEMHSFEQAGVSHQF